MFKTVILKYAPPYWDKVNLWEEHSLDSASEEYKQIEYEIGMAIQTTQKKIFDIVRIQNIHDLGQMLIREQLLVRANPSRSYFRVRRFLKIKKQFYGTALKYNLDHRRCGLANLIFKKSINYSEFKTDDLLVIVQVATEFPDNEEIIPDTTLQYFIDYIISFSN